MDQDHAIPPFTSTCRHCGVTRSHEIVRMKQHRRVGTPLVVALVCAASYSSPIQAHHSTAEYDSATFVEARGEVTKVLWQNPHVRLEISTERFDGVAQLWLLEGQNPGDLDRARIPRDVIKVGDTVTFAGNPSTRRERRMYVTNVLLPDRTEIALRANAQPRWSPDRYLSHLQATVDPERAAADRGDGIFRVWLPIAAMTPDWAADPPLTETARAAWLAYDAIRDDPVVDCTPPGMPQVITRSGRYAIRFVRMGDDIVLENEYRDIERVIHMTAEAESAGRRAPTPLGWSTGKWDGAVARRDDDGHRLALLPALRPRRRAAEPRDDDRRALHTERRRPRAHLRHLGDRPAHVHAHRDGRRLPHVSLATGLRVSAAGLHPRRRPRRVTVKQAHETDGAGRR